MGPRHPARLRHLPRRLRQARVTGTPSCLCEWAGETQVWAYVDCAELLDVNVDRTGDQVKLTLTGKPDDGDCTDDWMVLKVDPGARSFIDASTGKSIKLPPYVPSSNPGHG